jgi:2-polyprenyl-3-methyl-5-hydroxy-6-metoxy-1,4-benzoquinol methylase
LNIAAPILTPSPAAAPEPDTGQAGRLTLLCRSSALETTQALARILSAALGGHEGWTVDIRVDEANGASEAKPQSAGVLKGGGREVTVRLAGDEAAVAGPTTASGLVLCLPDPAWADPWQVQGLDAIRTRARCPLPGLSLAWLLAACAGQPPDTTEGFGGPSALTPLHPTDLEMLTLAAASAQRNAELACSANLSCVAALQEVLRDASAAARPTASLALRAAAMALLAALDLAMPPERSNDTSALQWHCLAAARWLAEIDPGQRHTLLEVQRQHPATAHCLRVLQAGLCARMAMSPSALDALCRLQAQGLDADFVLTKADPQAVGFMADIAVVLRNLLLPAHAGQALTVLDIGCKSGAGSELLGYLCQPKGYSKLTMAVTCADIDTSFENYCRQRHPHVEYLAGDAFTAGRHWDIVIASHVVEHVDNPHAFVQQLQTLARRFVVLAFPFAEDPKARIPGHLHTLDHTFLRALSPRSVQVYEGLFWTQSLCCIAVLEGHAAGHERPTKLA